MCFTIVKEMRMITAVCDFDFDFNYYFMSYIFVINNASVIC